MKLLIVDESEVMLDMMNEMIKLIPGIDIIGNARSGEEAIALFLSQRPDVVFLDVRLRHGKSMDILRAIKDQTPSVLVFVLTPQKNTHYERDYKKMRADFIFDKTLELTDALDKLREINRQTRDEKRMN